MRIRRLLAVTLVLATTFVARADTIEVNSTTLLNVAKQTRGGTPGQAFDLVTTAPAFEILSITARDVRNSFADDLTFVVKSWAAYDFGDRRWDNGTSSDFTGDLVTAYAQGRFLNRRLTIRAGRETVSTGVARNLQIDGGELILLLPAGFRISGYVGVPVSQRFAARSAHVSWNPVGGNLAEGGRLAWSLALPGGAGRGLDLGVSVNNVEDHGDPVRQEVGVDARVKPVDAVVFTGFGAWSIWDRRMSEGSVRGAWSAAPKLLVEADYRFVAPDLLLARNSILSVFSSEERHFFGGGATYTLRHGLKLGGAYHAVVEPGREEGTHDVGHEADARVEWERGPTLAGLEGFLLAAVDNGYTGGRVFARRELGRAFAAADVLLHVFRHEVNGEKAAVTGSLTLGYQLLNGLSAVVSGQAGVTPFMEQTFEVMAKLVYNQTYRKTEVR
jgi:hypothetical protein